MPKPDLRAVSSELPDPPYPADTRAKGLDFDIDVERLINSDTWDMATFEQQNYFLRIIVLSWTCIPVGSYPDDDSRIARKVGMPLNLFSEHKFEIMRGWVRHSDGRLYHPVVTERVMSVSNWREKNNERQRKWRKARAKKVETEDVTQMSRVTNELLTGDSRISNAPSSSSSSSSTSSTGATGPQTVACGPPVCPHKEIIRIYHEKLPACRQVRTWGGRRMTTLKARWSEDSDRQGLEWWEGFFDYVSESKFLTGRSTATNGRPPFVADLEWLLIPSNFEKVNEGKYHGA